jgi:transcriptional regulator with XRE-family HTH domain/quercetin dioxygenase-like cupin family protein
LGGCDVESNCTPQVFSVVVRWAARKEALVSPKAVPQVGERIREERVRRGLTLRGLARVVGVSASLISQIETGKSQPSVSTLYAITTALGVSIEDVFDTPDLAADVPRPVLAAAEAGSAGLPTTVLDALASRGGLRVGPVVRPADREILELDSGVTWERLGRVPGTHVDFLLITYAPGGSSSSNGRLMRHPGREYGYLVQGELTVTLGFDEHLLRPGDAVCFESSTPHRYRNDGEQPAVGVWFVIELDGG